MITSAYPVPVSMPYYMQHPSPSVAIAVVTAATAAAAAAVTGIQHRPAGSVSYGYPVQPHVPISHHSYGQHPSENGYSYTSSTTATKHWVMPMPTSTTSMVTGQSTPGHTMIDLCIGVLYVFSPSTRPTERSELKRFVQAVLESSSISADVVLLALYYLHQITSTRRSTGKNIINSSSPLPLHAIVVDTCGVRLDGGDNNSTCTVKEPSVQLRLWFVAALTCAHKFDADAAYTTRTWADLSGLEAPELVRTERELLARLDFQLSVSRDELNAFHSELNQQMTLAAAHTNRSSYHSKASQLPRLSLGGGLSSLRCACSSCVVYPGDAISPATTPTEIWPSTALHKSNHSMCWPNTPTSKDIFKTVPSHTFYGCPFQPTSAPAMGVGMNDSYNEDSRSQTTTPFFAAPTTVITIPEPHIWTGFSYSALPSNSTSSSAYNFDTGFPSSTVPLTTRLLA